MVFQVYDVDGGNAAPFDGHARSLDAVGVTRHQGMPSGQGFSFRQQAIRTRGRHPAQFGNVFWGECDAIGHEAFAFKIVRAATCFHVQQAAGDIGVADLARVDVFKFFQTTATAAVAQRFPLSQRHVLQALFAPKRPVLLGVIRPKRHRLSRRWFWTWI